MQQPSRRRADPVTRDVWDQVLGRAALVVLLMAVFGLGMLIAGGVR